MNFLSFVIALSLHQVLNGSHVLQRDAWLNYLYELVGRLVPGQELRLAALLLGVALGADALLGYLDSWLFGLPMILAAAVIMVWSLGRDDYHTALECFEARYDLDREAACAAARDLWAPLKNAGDQPGVEPEGDADELALQRLAYSAYERWFGPVFYFVAFGPVGALIYRVVCVLAARDGELAALRLLYWIHWVPARLLALTFALTGDFLAVVQNHPPRWFLQSHPVPRLLRDTAACACRGAEGARAISSIMYRSAGLWLLLISIGVLFL